MIQLSWLVAFTLAGLKMLSILYCSDANSTKRALSPWLYMWIGMGILEFFPEFATPNPPLAKAEQLDRMRACLTA